MPRHCPNVPLNVRLPKEVNDRFEEMRAAGNESRTQMMVSIINFAYSEVLKNRKKGGEE